MKRISLLGATGSIGRQTLDVIQMHPDCFELVAISVGNNIDGCREIIQAFKPKLVAVKNKEDCGRLKSEFLNIQVTYGELGLIDVATYKETDVVVNAVVGSVGLIPTIHAIEAKKTIALANKETLVTAGQVVMEAARQAGVKILPIDSEHSAIFQCLCGEQDIAIEKLILTGSGGSFRDLTREELDHVTIDQALNHPNWSMGAKITIDSATMMNKGLEVIEAHWLFNIPYEKIEIVLHRESIIHSMVVFQDSSMKAILGNPDMRVPIQYALSYPERFNLPDTERLNLWEVEKLHFKKMDFERYPLARFAYEAGKIGGTMPTVLNAANEEAVGAFLNKKISFLAIENFVQQAMEQHEPRKAPSLEVIRDVDIQTRNFVKSLVK